MNRILPAIALVAGLSLAGCTGGATGEMAKARESSKFEPAQCKDITLNLINSKLVQGGTSVTGASNDNVLSAGLSSFDSVDDAQTQLDGTEKVAEQCSDVKLRTAGLEMQVKMKASDPDVGEADETAGIVASVENGGQTATEIQYVAARVDNSLVAVTNVADGEEATVTNAADAFVESVKKAG